MLELNNIINQMSLADIYRTFYLAPPISFSLKSVLSESKITKGYTFLAAHGTFSKTDHITWTQDKSQQLEEN